MSASCSKCHSAIDEEDELDCAGCGVILCQDCANWPDGDDLPFCDDCAERGETEHGKSE